MKLMEQIIQKLERYGYKPKNVQQQKNERTTLFFESSQITINQKTLFTEFSLAIDYRLTFDPENVEYLNTKGIKYWSIYKHWLQFNYQPKDEQDLLTTINELLETYA